MQDLVSINCTDIAHILNRAPARKDQGDATALGEMSGILREAVVGKGNFGLGEASAGEVDAVGRAWVGDDAKLASDRKTIVSKNGLRQYRPPSFKPNLGRVQANLEARLKPEGPWQSNGHIDIVP